MKRLEKVIAVNPEAKRKKIEPCLSRRTHSFTDSLESGDLISRLRLSVPAPKPEDFYKIQQAKEFAVAQAQHDGCMGSFRLFDSALGNVFLPVIPTRADLTT